MSFSQVIDNIIADGTRIDELSKKYLDDSEEKEIESLYILSIFGIFVPFLSPIIYYSVKRRKEAAIAILVVLSAVLLSVLSLFLWGIITAILTVTINLAVIAIWIRGIYLFINEFIPLKKQTEEMLKQQQKRNFENIVYEPNKNTE